MEKYNSLYNSTEILLETNMIISFSISSVLIDNAKID